MKKTTWRVESGQAGCTPNYISEEFQSFSEALDDAIDWLSENVGNDQALCEDSFIELRETHHLLVSAQIFPDPDDAAATSKETSIEYIRIEEGPFDYDNTSERV